MNEESIVSGTQEVAIPEVAAQATDDNAPISYSQPPAIADEGDEGATHHDGSEAYLTTLFNHEARHFDRAEAEKLVQLGLYSQPHIEQLKYLARLSGEKGVKELLSGLVAQEEQRLTDEISGKVSDPELAQQIISDRLAQLRENLTDDHLDRQRAEDMDAVNRRLAGEFIELQAEFPQIDSFAALPQWVKECAAGDGVPLKYAYALHACRQQAKISAAEAQQQTAARAAAHSLKSEASDGTSPEMAGVYKALWGQY